MDDHRDPESRRDRIDSDVVVGRADPAGREQIVVEVMERSSASPIAARRRGRSAPRPAGCPDRSARSRPARHSCPGCARTGSHRRSPLKRRSNRCRLICIHPPFDFGALSAYLGTMTNISPLPLTTGSKPAQASSSSMAPTALPGCAPPANLPPRSSITGATCGSGRDHRRARPPVQSICSRRRGAGDARLPRLHQELLHLDQPCRVPRHSRRQGLKDGDIVNIDVTPILDGWHGDTSRMFLVGNVP